MKNLKRSISAVTACVMLSAAVLPVHTADKGVSENVVSAEAAKFNYAEALQKSLFFYEVQQAGPLPEWNRVTWRADATMSDDVLGGWYDAGDHVKFNLPMAYSATMLAWGLYQYGDGVDKIGQYEIYQNNLEFVLDYLVDCDRGDEVVYQIGDGEGDHKWWGAAELVELEMGKRNSYTCNASCVTGEMAAALAAGAAALKGKSSKTDEYIKYAEHYFDIAYTTQSDDTYTEATNFYNSWSGFWDELFWAANWLYIATGDKAYLDKATECIPNLGRESQSEELKYTWGHCWDDVTQGGFLLYAINTGEEEWINQVGKHLEYWSDPSGYGSKSLKHLPGGLVWLDSWGCLRYACNAGFLAAVACDTIFKDNAEKSAKYKEFYENQIDYCLGDNPDSRSYVVGFGENPPEHPHHRTSHGTWDDMKDEALKHHRHVLYGALVGGPGSDGSYEDAIDNYVNNEVATDYNAGFTALLCKMVSEYDCKTLPDFPVAETPDGPEFYVQANINQESDSYTELKINAVNHSAWPARYISDLSYNYYFDLSEVFAAGLTVDDVTVKIGYDEWANATAEGPFQYSGDIYYIKVKYEDGSVLAPIGKEQEKAEIQVRISIPDANKVWDSSNDYSREGITKDNMDQTITDKITMYDGDTLVWGVEPDGTTVDDNKPEDPKDDPIVTDPSQPTTPPDSGNDTIIYGDLNDDKNVDLTDLTTLSLALLKDVTLTEKQKLCADVQYDGEINLADLAKFKQYISKDDVVLGK